MGDDASLREISRRSLLGSVAGAGILSAVGSSAFTEQGSAANDPGSLLPEGFDPQTPVSSHHPGEPRFVAVGETLFNPVWAVGFNSEGTPEFDGPDGDTLFDKGRDHLGPRLPTLGEGFDGYDADAFEWSLVDAPDGSAGESEVLSFATPSSDVPRYDEGRDNVVEFEADAEGWYTLQLDAPDGSHELTIYAFPETDGAAVYPSNDSADNGAPRVALDAEYDADAGTFTIHSNADPAPQVDSAEEDLSAVFIADDRDGLSTADIDVGDDALTATVAVDDIEGSARVHTAAFDDNVFKKSAADVIELYDDGEIDLPSRPPEWLTDGVMYQIFPRSWGGEREATTLETLIDGTLRDGDESAQGVEYLDELGVDVLWITPVVPATSVERQFAYRDGFDIEEGMGIDPDEQHLSGGGPHGYDTSDYTGVSQDLSSEWDRDDALTLYEEFVDECHDHDIKVLFDIVINHAGRTHPQFQDTIADSAEGDGPWPVVNEWDIDSPYFDWWDRADVDLLDESGGLLETAPRATGFADLQVMPNLNFDNVALREYMLSVADFWSREVGVDGFRADIAYGVPHDVWKEMREIVRANDGEFLMFDESIPRVAALSENMFSLHHDTAGFLTTTHDVIGEDTDGGSLFGDIEQRTEDAIPDHSLFVNTLENHDERRALNQAVVDPTDPNHGDIPDETWEFFARRMRLCWAAAITMPGVPKLYYGQERQISRFGEGRHLGEEDDRGFQDDGESINVAADVRPGGRQRAFMNWEEYPEDHLEFYQDLIDFYHEYEVLHTDAGFEPIFFEVEENDDWELLLFGRDATGLDVDGPERVSVVINFGQDPETVQLDPGTATYDLLHDEDVAADHNDDDDSVTIVEVDDIVVLETEDFGEEFEAVATWDVPEGTDDGPGWYEYPTDDAFNDGAFDIRRFEVRESDENVQFALEVADLQNAFGGDNGFSLQFPHVFVRDPDSDIEGVDFDPFGTGTFVSFEEPYTLWIEADGFSDPRVFTADQIEDGGDPVATGTAETDGDEIVVTVTKDVFESDLSDLELAPLLPGEDEGGLRPVTQDGGEFEFEDTEFDDEEWDEPANPFTRHFIIDAVTPNDVDNDEALVYDTESEAVVPLLDMEEGIRNRAYPGELVREHAGGEETGFGPGDYVYPANFEIPDGSLDIDRVAVYEDIGEGLAAVAFEMDPAGLQNQFDLPRGFSHPVPQVYIRDPEGESPATIEAREGVQATLSGEYHYRAVADGESITEFEDAGGADVGDLTVELVEMDDAIVLEFSTDALNAPLSDHELAFAVSAHDGFGPGGLRDVVTADEQQDWAFAGADTDNAPRVIDIVTPPNVSQAEALSATADELATVPYSVEMKEAEDYIEDGEVSTESLQQAESDWEDGLIDTETLREVADVWRQGESE